MNNSLHNRLPFHYGWVIVGTGMLAIMAGLGLGRFSLGMLLPSMGQTLSLSYSEMGFVSTGNFIGYLLSVFGSGYLAARFGSSRVIVSGLALVGISMLLISRAGGFPTLLVLYFLTGIGSGAANIPTMALVSAWFSRTVRGRAAGFIVIGSGFAIILTGIVIPRINAYVGAEGWRVNWALLGALVMLVAVVARWLLRDKPEALGLSPVGSDRVAKRVMASDDASVRERRNKVIHLGALYFLFGLTYVIYVTFIVTSMVRDRGFAEGAAGTFWMWIGVLSLLSGPVFGTISDRFGRRTGFMLVFACHGISYLLAALPGTPGSNLLLYLSVGFFGIAAWSIPSIMAAAVGDYVGATRAPQVFGLVTFIFAIGQITGPAIAGMLADKTGTFSASFLMAAGFAALAVALSAALRKAKEV